MIFQELIKKHLLNKLKQNITIQPRNIIQTLIQDNKKNLSKYTKHTKFQEIIRKENSMIKVFRALMIGLGNSLEMMDMGHMTLKK